MTSELWLNAKEGSGRKCAGMIMKSVPLSVGNGHKTFSGSPEAMEVSSRPEACSKHVTVKLELCQAAGISGEGNPGRKQHAQGSADGLSSFIIFQPDASLGRPSKPQRIRQHSWSLWHLWYTFRGSKDLSKKNPSCEDSRKESAFT